MKPRHPTARQRSATARRRLQVERKWWRSVVRALAALPLSHWTGVGSAWAQVVDGRLRVNVAGRGRRLGPRPPRWVPEVVWAERTGRGWVRT